MALSWMSEGAGSAMGDDVAGWKSRGRRAAEPIAKKDFMINSGYRIALEK